MHTKLVISGTGKRLAPKLVHTQFVISGTGKRLAPQFVQIHFANFADMQLIAWLVLWYETGMRLAPWQMFE